MAKLGSILRNENRRRLANNQAAQRKELLAKTIDANLSDEEKAAARKKLQALPRNGSRTRVRNRCVMTGRPRAYLRKFGLCRIKFRELALEGKIPGVTKASW